MATALFPIRPEVPLFSCFSVEVEKTTDELPCWQKVVIVVAGLLTFGIGAVTLSYYWRNRLVDQLYAAECKKAQSILQARLLKAEEVSPIVPTQTTVLPTEEIHVEILPKSTEQVASPQTVKVPLEKELSVKPFVMPKSIDDVMGTIAPFGEFLTSYTDCVYVDKEKSRLFCFNGPSCAEKILIPKFLFDIIPQGVYFVVFAGTNRVVEIVDAEVYQEFAALIGVDLQEKANVIDLIIAHEGVWWDLITNPKSLSKPWFDPSRVCQVLYSDQSNEKAWKEICFKTSDHHGCMSTTINKFTKEWLSELQRTANLKRKQVVDRGIKAFEFKKDLAFCKENRDALFDLLKLVMPDVQNTLVLEYLTGESPQEVY